MFKTPLHWLHFSASWSFFYLKITKTFGSQSLFLIPTILFLLTSEQTVFFQTQASATQSYHPIKVRLMPPNILGTSRLLYNMLWLEINVHVLSFDMYKSGILLPALIMILKWLSLSLREPPIWQLPWPGGAGNPKDGWVGTFSPILKFGQVPNEQGNSGICYCPPFCIKWLKTSGT